MITLEAYFMFRREQYESEYKPEFEDNARFLLDKVNKLLADLKYENPIVSSGWRPPSYNKKVVGAAKGSHHQTGHAIDIKDMDGRLRNLILREEFMGESLLAVYELYLEDPTFTPTWIHLQDIPPRSGNYIFKP